MSGRAEAHALLANLRVGFGFDIHRFEPGVQLVLAGVSIEHDRGLTSHTDGDAVCHAVLDALYTACGLPDIGWHFPPGDPLTAGASSIELLRDVAAGLRESHIEAVLNVTVTLLAEHPRLGPQREAIAASLAGALQLDAAQVGVAFGTNERFDAVGRGEALACFANVLLLVGKGAGLPSAASKLSGTDALVRQPQTKTPVPPSADADLPPRVREFERAVKTKLPPLPTVPPPAPGGALILYTDGASRGNPGPAATGWALFNEQGMLVHEHGTALGRMTNNEAEYAALAEGLEWINAELGKDFHLTVRLDSELVVRQLSGQYKVKAEHLQELAETVRDLLDSFTAVQVEHIPRAQNARADALANATLDQQRDSQK